MQPSDRLVMMANQITRNLAIQGEEKAIELTADHIRKFWDTRMRALICKRIAEGGKGLEPIARNAIEFVSSPAIQPR